MVAPQRTVYVPGKLNDPLIANAPEALASPAVSVKLATAAPTVCVVFVLVPAPISPTVKTPPAGAAVTGKPGDLTQKPIPPGARTHVVAKGDTLASIATKFYKNKARAKDILDANFYSVDAATKLKIGQTLTIP